MPENNQYTRRKTIDYLISDLPFDKKNVAIDLIDIKNMRLKLSENIREIDFGSMLYTQRKEYPSIQKNAKYPKATYTEFIVKQNSYKPSRTKPLLSYLEHLFICTKKGISYKTLNRHLMTVISFVVWCDQNEHEKCLDSIKNAKKAFSDYVSKLTHENKIHNIEKKIGLSSRTAAVYQNFVKNFLIQSFDIEENELVGGIRLLRSNQKDVVGVYAPDHQTLGKNLALWLKLFEGIHYFLTSEKKYPFHLSLPNEDIWVAPSKRYPFYTKKQLKSDKIFPIAFDRNLGRILERDELIKRFGYSNGAANCLIKDTNRIFKKANNDSHHITKQQLAKIGHDAFFMIFMLYTRCRSDIRHIEWSNDTTIDNADTIGFKILKARAKGKVCEFRVSTKFIKLFKSFLELRDWQLKGIDYKYLFWNISKGKIKPAESYTASTFNKIVTRLIDNDLTTITPSQLRIAASDYFINKYDTQTAAAMLQNTPSVIEKNYSNGNFQNTSRQVTAFFKEIKNRIISDQSTLKKYKSTPTGQCKSYGNSISESEPPIDVSCQTPQSCFFCEHFAIHSDDTDIRKLLSIEYLIKETSSLAHNIEHFEATYRELLNRINDLLQQISNLDIAARKRVSTIRNEVFNDELLYPYWDLKLNQLVRLGAL